MSRKNKIMALSVGLILFLIILVLSIVSLDSDIEQEDRYCFDILDSESIDKANEILYYEGKDCKSGFGCVFGFLGGRGKIDIAAENRIIELGQGGECGVIFYVRNDDEVANFRYNVSVLFDDNLLGKCDSEITLEELNKMLIVGDEDSFILDEEEIRYKILKIGDIEKDISCVVRLYFEIERNGDFYYRDFLDVKFVNELYLDF